MPKGNLFWKNSSSEKRGFVELGQERERERERRKKINNNTLFGNGEREERETLCPSIHGPVSNPILEAECNKERGDKRLLLLLCCRKRVSFYGGPLSLRTFASCVCRRRRLRCCLNKQRGLTRGVCAYFYKCLLLRPRRGLKSWMELKQRD